MPGQRPSVDPATQANSRDDVVKEVFGWDKTYSSLASGMRSHIDSLGEDAFFRVTEQAQYYAEINPDAEDLPTEWNQLFKSIWVANATRSFRSITDYHAHWTTYVVPIQQRIAEHFTGDWLSATAQFNNQYTLRSIRKSAVAMLVRQRTPVFVPMHQVDQAIIEEFSKLWHGDPWDFRKRYVRLTINEDGTITPDSESKTSGSSDFENFRSDDEFGTVAWTNPDNAKTIQNTALANLNNSTSEYLIATNLAKGIVPPDATVTQITFSVRKRFVPATAPSNPSVVDERVRLVVGDDVLSEDKADSEPWSSGDVIESEYTFDGLNLVGEMLSSGDVGIAFSAKETNGDTAGVRLRHVFVKSVTYEIAPTYSGFASRELVYEDSASKFRDQRKTIEWRDSSTLAEMKAHYHGETGRPEIFSDYGPAGFGEIEFIPHPDKEYVVHGVVFESAPNIDMNSVDDESAFNRLPPPFRAHLRDRVFARLLSEMGREDGDAVRAIARTRDEYENLANKWQSKGVPRRQGQPRGYERLANSALGSGRGNRVGPIS